MKCPTRFLALLTATTAATALGVAPPATAELIDRHHHRDTLVLPGESICGLTLDVTISFVSNETARLSNTGFLLFSSSGQGTITFTNPANGLSITSHTAGAFRDLSVVDNGDGTITVRTAVIGIPGSVRGVDGRWIYKDRGRVVFLTVLDYNGTPTNVEDDVFISQTVESVSGPHPELNSDFNLFCETVIDQLS